MRWVKLRNLTSGLLGINGRLMQPFGGELDTAWYPYHDAQLMVQDIDTGDIDTTLVDVLDEVFIPNDLWGEVLTHVYDEDGEALRNANLVWDPNTLQWVRMLQPTIEINGNVSVELGEVQDILEDIRDTDGIKKITDTVTIQGNVDVDNFPTEIDVGNLPTEIEVSNLPTEIEVSNFPTSIDVGNFPSFPADYPDATATEILEHIQHGEADTGYVFDWTGSTLNYIERTSDNKKLNFTWADGKPTAISDWS